MSLLKTQLGFRALVAAAKDPRALTTRRRRSVLKSVRGLREPDAAALARIPSGRVVVYHDLVMWSGTLTREAYDAKCRAFPFDGYPWRD